ncbi:MAG: helix-hairpin-helix domain-containing protein [Candidatus Krumholzibacteriia bacterium]
MNRREALGLALIAALVLLGRGLRRRLLVGPDGAWRDPAWLADRLPSPDPPAEPDPRRSDRLTTRLDPNSCSADSLQLLPGVGPAIAGRIVAARQGGVHFACARDLQGIRGIGPRLSAQLEPYLTFGQQDTLIDAPMRTAR